MSQKVKSIFSFGLSHGLVRTFGYDFRTPYVCLPRLPQGFPLQAFLPMTFITTFVVPGNCTVEEALYPCWQLSFLDT